MLLLQNNLLNTGHLISGSVFIPLLTASGAITNTDPVYSLSGSPSIPAIVVSSTMTNTDPVYAISGNVSIGLITASGDLANTPPVYDLSGNATLPNLFIEGNINFNILSSIDISGDVSLPQLTIFGSINNGNGMAGEITIPILMSGELKNNDKIYVVSQINSLANCNTIAKPTQIIMNTRIDLSEATLQHIKYIRPDSVSGYFDAVISGTSLVANLSGADIAIPGKWVFCSCVTIDNVVLIGEKKIIKFI